MTSAVILGMIVTMFPRPREQAKAIGVYAFVASAGGSVGLLAGGVITQSIDWHWIFFVNVPIGAATAWLARRLLPADEGIGLGGRCRRAGRGADHGLADGRRLRDRRPRRRARMGRRAYAGRAAGSASRCSRPSSRARRGRANPLVPLRVFRRRAVLAANAVQVLSVAGMFGMFFLGALYLRRVLRLRRAADRPRVPAGDARRWGPSRSATRSGS